MPLQGSTYEEEDIKRDDILEDIFLDQLFESEEV
jgi:hypothetical protein